MKHSEIRQTIIETASNLFYEQGYNSTGINEIIATAGIAKATLYNHFRSKEEICLAYLQYMNDSFLAGIRKFYLTKSTGQAQIIALFDFLLGFFQESDFNGCWCINTISEIPKDNQLIRNEIQLQKKHLIGVINNLVQNTFLNKSVGEIDLIARQIYLLYESAVAESHLHQENWPILAARKLCLQLLQFEAAAIPAS